MRLKYIFSSNMLTANQLIYMAKTSTKRLYLLVSLHALFLFAGCDSQEQLSTSNDSLGMDIRQSQIDITWNLLSNFEDDNQHLASLTFENNGDVALTNYGWTLYFNSIRVLDEQSLLPEFKMTHLGGDFFKLEPTEEFSPILPGSSIEKQYKAQFHAIKKTDAPQGFYFVYENHIENVENVTVEPFVGDEQVNRNPSDNLDVLDAKSRFQKNQVVHQQLAKQVGYITPEPKSTQRGDGRYNIEDDLTISYTQDVRDEAEILGRVLKDEFGIEHSLQVLDTNENGVEIILKLKPDFSQNHQAYALQITEAGIEIIASGQAGIFYAIQSLRALLSNARDEELALPVIEITDEPAFDYRGMHFDVARNFQGKESILRLLDIMGMYKLNKLHFHLTDDEGWRLEIEDLPELTEVGGRRGHTESEEQFLSPSYGSGPDPSPNKSFGSGWFTREEYIEILQYADQRHIEVIPEIDVPGHARAAIKAMESRFNRLSTTGQSEQAELYRLTDPDDQSEYTSVQFYNDNVINICTESTYNFMDKVFDEVMALHDEAGVPLNMIHVGGDEVPQGVWTESPLCDTYMEQNGIEEPGDLFNHFFTRLEGMLEDRGLQMGGWEEVALNEDHTSPKEDSAFIDSVVPYVWSSIWGSGREDYAYMLANAGYDVVLSNASNLYFDMAYDKSWEEPGFYWASMFGTKDTYSFIPYDLYKNAQFDNYGNPVDPAEYADDIQLNETSRANIIGIQGQLWSETVNESQRWEYMVLPRLLGLAERAWVGNPSWGEIENIRELRSQRDESWNEFAHRLGSYELHRLDRLFENLMYRLPIPGAIIENGMLKANSPYPDLDIRYEINGELGLNSPLYKEPVEVEPGDIVTLASFSSTGRQGRAVQVK